MIQSMEKGDVAQLMEKVAAVRAEQATRKRRQEQKAAPPAEASSKGRKPGETTSLNKISEDLEKRMQEISQNADQEQEFDVGVSVQQVIQSLIEQILSTRYYPLEQLLGHDFHMVDLQA